jgi:hypothetical protein
MTKDFATEESVGPDFSPLSWPDDYLMNRKEASRLSKAMGLPVAPQSLAKLHCISSEGPPTVKFGRLARLPVAEFKAWLINRTSPPRTSSSVSIRKAGNKGLRGSSWANLEANS